MNKPLTILTILPVLLFSGCATTPRQSESNPLDARVSALESQLAEKDSQMQAMQDQAAKEAAERERKEEELRRIQAEAAERARAAQSDLK